MKIKLKETHIKCYDKHNEIKDIGFDDFIHEKQKNELCLGLCDELALRGMLKFKKC